MSTCLQLCAPDLERGVEGARGDEPPFPLRMRVGGEAVDAPLVALARVHVLHRVRIHVPLVQHHDLIVRARGKCCHLGLLVQRDPDDVPRRTRVTRDGQQLLGAIRTSPKYRLDISGCYSLEQGDTAGLRPSVLRLGF